MTDLKICLDGLMKLPPEELLKELQKAIYQKSTVEVEDHAPMTLAEFEKWQDSLQKGDDNAN